MSNLNETPRGMRTALAFLGRRNAGKSSLLNALVGYDLAIVSAQAGTTTDPVEKAVEINPLGACLVIDTAGIDDSGELGQKRIEKTQAVAGTADVGLIVVGDGDWTAYEEELLATLQAKQKPFIVVLNKNDCFDYRQLIKQLQARKIDCVTTTALTAEGVAELKQKIRELKIVGTASTGSIVADIVKAGYLVLLVVPLDSGAPQGRLILPQVQTIRAILDNNACAIVVKENELTATLAKLGQLPELVITDSQVVLKVVQNISPQVPLTTFSTVFARYKGNLRQMVEGVQAIDALQDGDKILIAEACTHHAQADDIGRVKIPGWISDYSGKKLQFDLAAGANFPADLNKYRLILQCGGCTISRTAYGKRLQDAAAANVPITNYGVAISYIQGVLPRVIEPFPEMQDIVSLSEVTA